MEYLDHEVLDELSGMLGEDLQPILDEFIAELPGNLEALAGAVSSEDWTTAVHISHTIKGIAGNMGAVALSHVAADLEQAARDASKADVAPLVATLEQVAHASITAYTDAGFGASD